MQQEEVKTHYVMHVRIERVDRILGKVQDNPLTGPKDEVRREVNEVTSMTVKHKTRGGVIKAAKDHLDVIDGSGDEIDV